MKMLEKNVQNRQQAEIICLEDLVPENHLLRKIDRAVDFDKIYDFIEEVPVAAKRYADELMKEINTDRDAHGKKPFDNDNDSNNDKPKKKWDNYSL